jgi:hypothetical protein
LIAEQKNHCELWRKTVGHEADERTIWERIFGLDQH